MELDTASYEKEQQAFIDNNGLKIGDKVKITRTATFGEQNWDNTWVPDMNEVFGHIGIVEDFGDNGQGIEVNIPTLFCHRFNYPYFIIEKLDSIN